MWVRGACIATRDFRERWKWDELSGNQTRRYRLRVVQRIPRLPCTPSSRSLSLSIPFPLRRWALEAWIAWTGTKVWWLRGRLSAHCRARLRLACMMHAAGGIADPPFFPLSPSSLCHSHPCHCTSLPRRPAPGTLSYVKWEVCGTGRVWTRDCISPPLRCAACTLWQWWSIAGTRRGEKNIIFLLLLLWLCRCGKEIA